MSETKTAKQLEEEMIVKPDPDSTTQFEPFYEASAEQFQTYRAQLLKEQREICAKHAEVTYEPVIPGGGRTAEYISEVDKDSIINAPEPQ